MKSLTCWFPALREGGEFGFNPPRRPQRSVGALEQLLEREGKGEDQVCVGQGGQREGVRGLSPCHHQGRLWGSHFQ